MRIVPFVIIALLAACRSGPPELQTRVETVTVNVPTRAPCPEPSDVPTLPRRVQDENPAMPTLPDGSPDYAAISRILAAKVIELFTFGDRSVAIMTECSRPAQ